MAVVEILPFTEDVYLQIFRYVVAEEVCTSPSSGRAFSPYLGAKRFLRTMACMIIASAAGHPG